MQINILLQDPRGDEIGELKLEAVRLTAAGVETAPPDLGDQMAQLISRLDGTLTGLGFAPLLDPLGVRIAVSKALLDAYTGSVSIPLQVCPVNRDEAAQRARAQTPKSSSCTFSAPAGGSPDDEWAVMFNLTTEEAEIANNRGAASPSNMNQLDHPASPKPLDQWTVLGDIWGMDDEGGEL